MEGFWRCKECGSEHSIVGEYKAEIEGTAVPDVFGDVAVCDLEAKQTEVKVKRFYCNECGAEAQNVYDIGEMIFEK